MMANIPESYHEGNTASLRIWFDLPEDFEAHRDAGFRSEVDTVFQQVLPSTTCLSDGPHTEEEQAEQ